MFFKMSQVENLALYFVLRSDGANEEDSCDDMIFAYKSVVEYGATAKWIKPSSCLEKAASSKDVFVFEKFEGEVFEELKKHSAKILGARCLLTCINSGKSIPSAITPIFSEGMRDLVICCTGFDSKAKKQLREKVEYMAGIYDQTLRAITTHLVAYNNIAPKAIEAYKSKVPIMRYEWVEAVWEKSKYQNVNGKDEQFNSYISPIFHNLKITTGGISKKEKEILKEFIESNGGTFSGTLEANSTNILVVSKPEGEKFKFAKLWKIPCVKPSWIYNSVSSQTIHQLSSYILHSKNLKSSTPNKEVANFTANFSMMSAIAQEPDRMITHLEETGVSLSGDSVRSHFATPKRLFASDNNCDIINNVLLKNLKDSGLFLDGCNIYLCGFSSEDTEKLKKVLNVGGATRFNDLNEFVTHVIVGKKSEGLLSSLKNIPAHVLTVDWLAESMKMKKPASEIDFLVFEKNTKPAEPPSPLSKIGAKLLTTVENHTIEKPQFSLDKENEKLMEEEEELLSKYKQSQPGEPLTPRENPLTRSTSSSMMSRTDSLTPSDEFFKGLSFFLSSELVECERKELEERIQSKGGSIAGKRFLGIPDYAVVPICGASLTEITTKEVVNVFFIKDCCFEGCIVPLQYYHQPVACVKSAAPLKDLVISISNYVQCEREFIECLIQILGAVLQSVLARKPKENIKQSTHLVCAEPVGEKYNGAVRWGLPVVHQDWLMKCAALGIHVSEQPYLIGESKMSTTSSDQRGPSKTAESAQKSRNDSSNHEPKTSDKPGTSSLKCSPIHNTIWSLKSWDTPETNSPDGNRTLTPTSPYGAFYGNDNPSPGTRKRLWKWMHQGADFPVDPPTNYQTEPKRRNSTPLSTVLSKLLMEMKRKPEEIPTDSPVSVSKRPTRGSSPDSACAIPFKRMNLDGGEAPEETKGKDSSVITTGLQKMKEIEEEYAKNCAKPSTPARKQGDSAPQMLVVAESQPHTEVGWEDPNEKEIALKKLEKAAEGELKDKLFMLNCLNDAEEVAKLIEDSGGKVSQLPHFDRNATHLITKDLTRDEKLIASIAAGLWVLHPSYLEELEVVRNVHKVSEEFYEWGNPNKTERAYSLPMSVRAFAKCSFVSRINARKGLPPPFKDMKIILHLRPKKFDNFRRIVEAGGGVVPSAKPPYSDDDVEADVCVVDDGHSEKVDFKAMAKRGIPCVTVLYIGDRILKKVDAIDKNIAKSYRAYWKRCNVVKTIEPS